MSQLACRGDTNDFFAEGTGLKTKMSPAHTDHTGPVSRCFFTALVVASVTHINYI